ncbi:MAG: hypothetical protein ACK2TX_10530 [Anaerolineales bacterium]
MFVLLALLLSGCAGEKETETPIYPDAAKLPTLPPRTVTPSPLATTGTATSTYYGTPPTEVPATFYYTFTPHPPTPTSTPAGTPTPTHEPGPQDYRLSTLHMINELDGWGTFRVGDSMAEQYWLGITHDGAQTWLNITPPVFEAMRAYLLPNLSVMGGAIQTEPLDSETAWAYTRCLYLTACNFTPGIWYTEDGGRSWKTVHGPSDCAGVESDCIPDTLQFVDPQHGWLFMMQVGRNSITYHLYRTVDGGFTWEKLPGRPDWVSDFLVATRPLFLDQSLGLRFQRIYVSPANQYAHVPLDELLSGKAYTLEMTRDGGNSWFNVFLPLPPGLPGILKAQDLSEDDELLIDNSPLSIPAEPLLISFQAVFTLHWDQPPIFQATYFSTDRGRSWKVLSKPGDSFFLDAEHGWRLAAADPSKIEVTTDGGNTWQPFIEATWEVGKAGDKNIAVHFTEGGQNLQEIETAFFDERLWPGQGVRLESLQMQDRLSGWGLEVGGETLCTQDGARTWKRCLPVEGVVPTEAVPPDTEGVWSPVEPLPEELFHGEPIPAELERWIENGLQFLPEIRGDDVGFSPFAYFCKTMDADWMGDGRESASRRCVIRFPTREGSVYAYYVAYWLTYYSLTLDGEQQQVWPSTVNIDFIDEKFGWRLLDTGSGLFRLEHSEDGGKTWSLVKTVSWIGQLKFVGAKEGYALAFEPPTRDTPAELFFVDAMRPSSLLHTLDGGRTWEEIDPVIGS